MRRLLGALALALFLPAQWALAAAECFTILPQGSVAVGDQVQLGGGGFDAATQMALFVGASNIAGGTTDASGTITAKYAFDSPGDYPVQVFGFVGGELCASDRSNLLVEGDGESVPAVTVPDGFVPPLLTTTTTLVVGDLGYLNGWAVVVDLDGESVASATTIAVATTDAPPTTVVAAVAIESEDGSSILLPGVLTALAAVLLGLGAGWVTARRRS